MRLALVLALAVASACTAARIRDASGVKRFATLEDAPPSTLAQVDLDRIAGRWFVVRSNFAFWTKRDRSDPSFVYQPIHEAGDEPGLGKLADRVEFQQHGRARKYVGVDLQDPTRAGHFQWRGDGGLYALVNHWYLVHAEPDHRWAIVYFSKSNFGTDGGLEIIARTPTLDPADVARAEAIIAADPFLRAHSAGMFSPRHTAGS